jgi:MFS family permease
MSQVLRTWRQLDARVWRMALARTINTMGLSLVMAFLGVYMVEERGYPAWLYGVVALIANLGQSLSNAWAGALSDRIGRRPLITGGLLIRAVVIAVLGLQIWLTAPLWSLALNVVVSSALRGCFEPVAYALVTDVCRPDERIPAFGLQRMGTNLGWAIGPAMGGVLTLWIPYGAVFGVASAGLLLAAWVTTTVADPVTPRRGARPSETETDGGRSAAAPAAPAHDVAPRRSLSTTLASAWRAPITRALMIGSFFAAVLHTQLFSTFAIFMSDELGLGKPDVGLIYTFNGAAVVLLQLPALSMIRRQGFQRYLVLAPLIAGTGFVLVGAADHAPTVFIGGVVAVLVVTCGEVLFDPSHQTAIAAIADPTRRGEAYGVVGFAQMLGVAIAPVLGGGLFDALGAHHLTMWLVLGTVGVVQSIAFARFVRLVRNSAMVRDA